jgi:hypothetical protein
LRKRASKFGGKRRQIKTLTIATHADGDALLQATILTSVPVYPEDTALLVFGTRAILDFLLDRTTEEALQKK